MGGGGGEEGGGTRTRTRKLFYKDCSLGSVKNMSNN